MAELATLTVLLQQMTVHNNNQQAQQVEEMRRRNAAEVGALQQGMVDMQTAMAKAMARPAHRPGIVDVKGVGKPEKLQCKNKEQMKSWPNLGVHDADVVRIPMAVRKPDIGLGRAQQPIDHEGSLERYCLAGSNLGRDCRAQCSVTCGFGKPVFRRSVGDCS